MPFPFPRGVFPWAVSPATGYHSLKHSCGWQQTHHTTKVPGEFNTFRLRSPQTVSVDSAMNETGVPVSLRQMHPNCLTSRHFSVHANNAACAPSCHKAPILSRQTSIPCTSRPCLLTVHFRNADLSRQTKSCRTGSFFNSRCGSFCLSFQSPCPPLLSNKQGANHHSFTVIFVSFATAQAFSMAPRISPWGSRRLMVAPEMLSSSCFCSSVRASYFFTSSSLSDVP